MITNLDDKKEAPVFEADMSMLHTKGKEPPKSTSYGSESKPVGKAQSDLVLRVKERCILGVRDGK
jgi:hypothetical protein